MLEAFARRLRDARVELRLDQVAFAEMGGVKKWSQINYEAGRTPPPVDYLFRLAEHGVDIGYVLTGERRSRELDVEQRLLFEMFGKLSLRERGAIMALMGELTGQTTSTAASASQARARRQQLGNMGQSLHDQRQEFKDKDS